MKDCKSEIPDHIPKFEDFATQMRINADFIMKEITEHCDKEIERFKRETNS